MNKERLQEIKDSIDFQREFLIASNMQTLCVDEEMELYNEIIRLKKQKDDVVKVLKALKHRILYEEDFRIDDYIDDDFIDILLRMLGEIDVEDKR